MNVDAKEDNDKVLDNFVAADSSRTRLEFIEIGNGHAVVAVQEERAQEGALYGKGDESGGGGGDGDDVEFVAETSTTRSVVASSCSHHHQQQQQQSHKNQVCCPMTKQPFREPVVHCQGDSFEQEAIQEQFVNVVCHPNRALKECLNPKTDAESRHHGGGSISSSPQTGTTPSKFRGCFYCPMTCLLLRDPAIDPEGNTYERHAIKAWVKKHGDSPIARNPLKLEQLYDNTTLLSVLVKEVQLTEDTFTVTEEIEEWKKEVSDVPKADPPLSAKELEQALRAPVMVPDPSLSALRPAMGAPVRCSDARSRCA